MALSRPDIDRSIARSLAHLPATNRVLAKLYLYPARCSGGCVYPSGSVACDSVSREFINAETHVARARCNAIHREEFLRSPFPRRHRLRVVLRDFARGKKIHFF